MLKVWSHRKKDCPNLIFFTPILPTLVWANHVPIIIHMGVMHNNHSCSISNYNKANFILLMLAKAKVLGKKGKRATNKESITKLT
jgi:hypothetical protein